MVLTKDDIAMALRRKTGGSYSTAYSLIDGVFNEITNAMANGDSVQISGFGTFEPKKCAKRTGRNPHTNEAVPIPARIVPNFRAGKLLKKMVVKVID